MPTTLPISPSADSRVLRARLQAEQRQIVSASAGVSSISTVDGMSPSTPSAMPVISVSGAPSSSTASAIGTHAGVRDA